MNTASCLCKVCHNYSLFEQKISVSRHNKITNMLREHHQEKKNLFIYAKNIKLFLQMVDLLATKKLKLEKRPQILLLSQQHLFCKIKISMIVNTLKLLSTTERAIITGLYLDNEPIQQVVNDLGYESAQIYRLASLAIAKIALALPLW